MSLHAVAQDGETVKQIVQVRSSITILDLHAYALGPLALEFALAFLPTRFQNSQQHELLRVYARAWTRTAKVIRSLTHKITKDEQLLKTDNAFHRMTVFTLRMFVWEI